MIRTGDEIQIECKGKRVAAKVVLASPNGKSLALTFDEFLDGHVGMMPVLLGEDGVFRSIINGVEVKVWKR
jgi:hypothetical protein